MSRRTPSSPKATALPPRTLAKLHRAVAAARPLLEPLETRTLLTTLAINPFSMTGTLSEADTTTRYDFTLVRSDTGSFQTVGFAFAPLGDNPVDSADLTLLGDGVDNQLHTVTFAPGEIYASLHVAVIDDDLLEFDEQAQLQFFETESPAPVLASADLLVQSDDCRVWVTGGGTMNENSGTVDFIVHREDAYGLCPNAYAIAIRVKTAGQGDIRASADDYTVALDNMDPGPGPDPTPLDVHNYYWVNFQANQSQSLVTVAAVNDSLPEPTEWLKLVLIGGTGFTNDSPPLSQTLPTQAYAAIEDDDNYIAPPAPPTNLFATPFSNTAITLNWQDNSPNETGFLIEKSTDGVNWSTVQVFDPDTTTATVDNLDPAIDYAFRLRAENPNASVPSDFTPPLPASTQWQNLGAPLAVPIATTGESPIWLNNGESLVAGEGYRLVYSSGGVNYSSQSPPNTWTAASYAVRSEDWNYTHWQNEPNGFPFVPALDQVPSIANDLTWSFTSPGAPMALYFNAGDPQYYSGPGVTWQLQKQIPHVSVALNNGDHTTEGDTTPLQITLTRDAYFNEDLIVNYTLTPGTADANDIIDQYSGTATIAANSFSVDIPLLATDDTTPEWTENLQFTLTAGTGYIVDTSASSANIEITDNDLSFSLTPDTLIANFDDDDNNQTTDYEQSAATAAPDDDLYELTLNVPRGAGTAYPISLTVDSRINIWSSATKSGPLIIGGTGSNTYNWSNPSEIPSSVWLEIKGGSTDMNDARITLAANGPGTLPYSRDFTFVDLKVIQGGLDVSNKSADWLVGQMVGLQAVVIAPPAALAAASYHWTVPGSVLHDYTIIDNVTQHTATKTDLAANNGDGTGTDQSRVKFFWTKTDAAAPGPDQRTITVNVNNVNGVDLPFAATKFNVFTPVVTSTATTGVVTLIDDPNFGWVLELIDIANDRSGFQTKTKVEMPAGFAQGNWAFLQTTTSMVQRKKINGPVERWVPFGETDLLDMAFYYPKIRDLVEDMPKPDRLFSTGATEWRMYDSPGTAPGELPTLEWYNRADSFTSYVMFLAPGDSRWVPLAATNWGWSADINWNAANGVWDVNSSSESVPTPLYVPADVPTYAQSQQQGQWQVAPI